MVNFQKTLNIVIFFLFFTVKVQANPPEFKTWLKNFKDIAIERGVTKKTVDNILNDVKYLDQVIVYDNKQPEFFEKTNIYISKRASQRSAKKAKKKYLEYKQIFEKVEKEFKVEKELILALWSIETNFGTYFGKMDIVSSLATLSFDKRRSKFFTKELITLLFLVDNKIVSKEMLFGSWAGALGNFQFMPSTIKDYGIDYDGDGKIDLKQSMNDSIASAANYMNKIGWKYNNFCFTKVKFENDIDKNFFNHSARNLKNKKSYRSWNKLGVKSYSKNEFKNINNVALILPDGDLNSPKYLVSDNYEKILKWNRSLRFGLSVCTLAKMIKNEI